MTKFRHWDSGAPFLPSLTIEADRTVFTIDHNGGTILPFTPILPSTPSLPSTLTSLPTLMSLDNGYVYVCSPVALSICWSNPRCRLLHRKQSCRCLLSTISLPHWGRWSRLYRWSQTAGPIFTVYADFTVNAIATVFTVPPSFPILISLAKSGLTLNRRRCHSVCATVKFFTCCHFNCSLPSVIVFAVVSRISSCITRWISHSIRIVAAPGATCQVVSNLVAVFSFVNCYGVIVGSYYCYEHLFNCLTR